MTEMTEISLSQLVPHHDNVRLSIDQDAIASLAISIRTSGLLEPLRVTPIGEGTFRIVAGHRRFAAAKVVGLATVSCIVVPDLDEDAQMVELMAENLQRENLTPIEEAMGFERLAALGLRAAEIARRLGLAESRVTSRLQLLALPDDVQQLIHKGILPLKGGCGRDMEWIECPECFGEGGEDGDGRIS